MANRVWRTALSLLLVVAVLAALGAILLATGVLPGPLTGGDSRPSDGQPGGGSREDSRPPDEHPPPVPPTNRVPRFPDAATTGVPSGVELSPTERLVVEEDGAVVEGLEVNGTLNIRANNVTVRNVVVRSDSPRSPILVDEGAKNVLIEDTEVDCLGTTGIGVIFRSGSTGTLRRADVHSCSDGVRINSGPVLIEDSYVHDLFRAEGTHNDSIQIRAGDDVTIRGNRLEAYNARTDDPMNAAIQIGSLAGSKRISNLLVIRNLMNGGNVTVNGGGRETVESAVYTENRFGRDYRYRISGNLETSQWDDTNVWHDSGLPTVD